jgi:lipoate-protein ligase A
MSDEWRLLCDGTYEARRHFAVEEAVARLLDAGKSPPTLRMRQVYPAVFVGVHQNTWCEVDVDYCQAHGIQIVRRMNGGGGIYQEMGSFCFSAFFHRDMIHQAEEEFYRLFAGPVIETCKDYGVCAHYEGRNDVLVGNRKIYGSAQFSWYRAFVQSGTFLVNIDFDVMAHALTPPAEKFAGKPSGAIRERVTSLSREVGNVLDTHEVMSRFTTHAAETLGIQLAGGELTREERELANQLLSEKYDTDKWNLGSQMEYQITVAGRTEEGVLSLSADIEGRSIRKARITGDLLINLRQALDNLELAWIGCTIPQASAIVQDAQLPVSIRDALLHLLDKLGHEINVTTSERSEE